MFVEAGLTETVNGPGYWLDYNNGKAVQEILNAYKGELEEQKTAANRVDGELTWQLAKDIDYIEGLAKLFD